MSQTGEFAIAILLGLSAMISLILAVHAWRRHQTDGRLLAIVMLAVAVWLSGYGAELLLSSLTAKLYAARVQYIGIATVPVAWLIFALCHTSRYRWADRRVIAALSVIPAITIGLAWTSSSHALLWSSVDLDPDASATGLVVEYGGWFWVHTAYSYILLAVSNVALILLFARALRLYRRQASLMLVGLFVPWIANAIYLSMGSETNIDPTPIGVALSGVLLAWGLWRWRLLDVKPIPRARSVESMRDGVIVLDHRFRIIDFNAAAAALLGFGGGQIIGQAFAEVAPGLRRFQHDLQGADKHRFQVARQDQPGGHRVLEASVSPFDDSAPEDRGYWLVMVRDVTEQDRAEQQLRAAELRYRTLVEQMPAITYIRDWSDQLRPSYMSPQIEDLLGYTPGAICAADGLSWEQLIFLEDVEEVENAHRRATEQQGTFSVEYRMRSASGRMVWLRDEAVAILDGDGQPLHWQGVIVDITAQKQLESQLERYAFYDTLTGLPNRALLLDRLRHSLSRIQREGKLVGVLFIDLDGFKIINDTLGHAAGDHVLQEIARRLTTCLRTGDTAGRLGGDEFVVVVETTGDAETVVQIANRIIGQLRQPMTSSGQDVVVNCSVGIRTSRSADEAPEDLLRDADVAMYWAKSRGRSQAVVFDPMMLAHRWNRLGMEAELRAAIRDEQLDVYYQPIVSFRTGRIAGFEALLRWTHPERGEILPDEFLPVAADSGLIVPIDQWTLMSACRQLARWQKMMPADYGPPLTVSVNITPEHIQQSTVIDDIQQVLQETGLPASQLMLEITESHTMQDTPVVGERLTEIQRLGVKVIIDDFGTGYSALAYLQQFAIAGIKIDRSFVNGLGTRPDDTSLVNAVVSLARSFGLDVTAEGIERQSQWSDLAALGAHYGQGHFLTPPLPAVEIERLIAAGNLMALIDLPDQPQLRIVSGE